LRFWGFLREPQKERGRPGFGTDVGGREGLSFVRVPPAPASARRAGPARLRDPAGDHRAARVVVRRRDYVEPAAQAAERLCDLRRHRRLLAGDDVLGRQRLAVFFFRGAVFFSDEFGGSRVWGLDARARWGAVQSASAAPPGRWARATRSAAGALAPRRGSRQAAAAAGRAPGRGRCRPPQTAGRATVGGGAGWGGGQRGFEAQAPAGRQLGGRAAPERPAAPSGGHTWTEKTNQQPPAWLGRPLTRSPAPRGRAPHYDPPTSGFEIRNRFRNSKPPAWLGRSLTRSASPASSALTPVSCAISVSTGSSLWGECVCVCVCV
jgi:hypothetical protein